MATNPTVELTPEVIKQDGQNRVAKTAGQVGGASSVVVVGLWVAHQIGWHGDMPPEVVAATIALLTGAAGYLTNLSKLRGRV